MGESWVVGKKVVIAHYAVAVVGPWGLLSFFGLAVAVLWAVDRWMAVLGPWPDEGAKGDGTAPRVLLAALSTLAVVGAWYGLAFVAIPSGA